jgi:hypothetical protein
VLGRTARADRNGKCGVHAAWNMCVSLRHYYNRGERVLRLEDKGNENETENEGNNQVRTLQYRRESKTIC